MDYLRKRKKGSNFKNFFKNIFTSKSDIEQSTNLLNESSDHIVFSNPSIDTKYIAIPPSLKSINIGDDKFVASGPPYVCKNKNETHYFWRCNQYRTKCVATIITIKSGDQSYPEWALYGYISNICRNKKTFSVHNHEPKWTLSDAHKEWSVHQMIIDMSLNPVIKPRRATKQHILDYPIESFSFKNINKCVRRLYYSRECFAYNLPKTIEEIDYIAMESEYSFTYHKNKIILQNKMKDANNDKSFNVENIVKNHHLPYHVNHHINGDTLKYNKINNEIYKLLSARKLVLSLDTQNKINKMWLSSIFLGKTASNCYIFQSLHGSYRWSKSKRKDVDGSLWKQPYISIKSPLGQKPFSQDLFFMDHIYSPDSEHVPRVLPNTMIWCVSKKKIDYGEIADVMVQANQKRGYDITGFLQLGMDCEPALETFSKKFKVREPSLVCLYHYTTSNTRRLRKYGLFLMYLHDADFRYELKIYLSCLFLETDEVEVFRAIQIKKVSKSIQRKHSKKRHNLKGFKKAYEKQYGVTVPHEKYNMFRREADFTQDSVESINRRMTEDVGYDKSIFSNLRMWQRTDAISSYWFDTLEKNNYDKDCFDNASPESRESKILFIKHKQEYAAINKELRTYQDQRNYLSKVVSTFTKHYQHILEEIKNEMENEEEQKEKMQQISNDMMLKLKYTHQWSQYPPTKKYIHCFNDIMDSDGCNALLLEIIASDIWIKMITKHNIKKHVCYANKLKNFEEPIDTYFERSIIAIKEKTEIKYYAGIVLMYSDNMLSVCFPNGYPLNESNWEIFNVDNVIIKLL